MRRIESILRKKTRAQVFRLGWDLGGLGRKQGRSPLSTATKKLGIKEVAKKHPEPEPAQGGWVGWGSRGRERNDQTRAKGENSANGGRRVTRGTKFGGKQFCTNWDPRTAYEIPSKGKIANGLQGGNRENSPLRGPRERRRRKGKKHPAIKVTLVGSAVLCVRKRWGPWEGAQARVTAQRTSEKKNLGVLKKRSKLGERSIAVVARTRRFKKLKESLQLLGEFAT